LGQIALTAVPLESGHSGKLQHFQLVDIEREISFASKLTQADIPAYNALRVDVNLSLTNALKTVTTSFRHGLATSHCHVGAKTEGNMFVAIRIIILIASAYAGSAVAEMQGTSPKPIQSSTVSMR
jgi:hypothetical protein